MPNQSERGGAQAIDREPVAGGQLLRAMAEGITKQHKMRQQARRLSELRDSMVPEIDYSSQAFMAASSELLSIDAQGDQFRDHATRILRRSIARAPGQRNPELEMMGMLQMAISATEGPLVKRVEEMWQSEQAPKWTGKKVVLWRPDTNPASGATYGLDEEVATILESRSGQAIDQIGNGLVVAGVVEDISIGDQGEIRLVDAIFRFYGRSAVGQSRVFNTEWEQGPITISQVFGEIYFGDNDIPALMPKFLVRQVEGLSDRSYPQP